MSRSHGYEERHSLEVLFKCAAAAAAGVGLHVARTALVSSFFFYSVKIYVYPRIFCSEFSIF